MPLRAEVQKSVLLEDAPLFVTVPWTPCTFPQGVAISGTSRKRGCELPGSVSGRRSTHFPSVGAVLLENGMTSPVPALISMGVVAFFHR